MLFTRPLPAIVPCLVVALLAASTSLAATPASAELCAAGTLCQRLGGPAGLSAIAATLVDTSVADPRTREHWRDSDLVRVKRKLGEYLCVLSGGRCPYDNDDLRAIHAGQHIRSAEFYALVENLRAVLDERGVGTREKNELLGLLAPAKRDVVEP